MYIRKYNYLHCKLIAYMEMRLMIFNMNKYSCVHNYETKHIEYVSNYMTSV